MTGPVTTEALVEKLAQTMWEQSYGTLANASWAEAHRIAEAIPDGQAAWNIETVRRKAAEIVALHFAPLLAAHQQVTAERDEARNPFGNFTPTVERIALLMGRVWLEAKGAAGDTVADFEEFAMLAPEDCADCCTVAKAVLAAVDPAKANERADAAEASLATATSELARLRAEGEAKDRARVLAAGLIVSLCDSVLGDAYLGKEAEEELAADLKRIFSRTALARAATAREMGCLGPASAPSTKEG